jgi:hypothetical protein
MDEWYEELMQTPESEPLDPPAIPTLGRFFPDGSAIEMLSGDCLVLHKKGGEESIRMEISFDGEKYEAWSFSEDRQIKQLTRFPAGTKDFGTIAELIDALSKNIATYVPVDADTKLLLASFVLSTWVVDCLPTAPVLNLWGPPGTENPLIGLLSCLCRRPVRLTEPTVRELTALPEGLCPTIILKRPSHRVLTQLLAAATERDFSILRAGRRISLQCAIVAYTEEPFAGAVLSLPMLEPTTRGYEALGKTEAEQLIDDLQSRLLRYRLSQHVTVTDSRFDDTSLAPQTQAVARLLGASAEGDTAVQNKIVDALRGIDEGIRMEQSQSPAAAVLEALLVLCHERKGAAFVVEVTELANAILMARHDGAELSPKAVGGILRSKLGLSPRRRGPGYEVELTGAIQQRVHRLGNRWGVLSMQQPVDHCNWCKDIHDVWE